jgi:hypothetical protein
VIIEAIVSLLAGFFTWVGGLFGEFNLPGWFSDLDDGMDYLADQTAGFNNWVPMVTMVNCMNLVMAAVGIGLVIKLVRIVASFFTAGGGSAA